MIAFLKQLFGLGTASDKAPKAGKKPPLPEVQLEEFKAWFDNQRLPAIALSPNPDGPIGARGSRIGGPAWLAEGEQWPLDKQGVPLEFLAQLDCVDSRGLPGYPSDGIIQFFIGRDNTCGADFDNLLNGSVLVRWSNPETAGTLCSPPPLAKVKGVRFSDVSPIRKKQVRETGLPLAAQPFEDWIDQSIKDAEEKIYALYQHYDIADLEQFVEDDELARPPRHHTGGYPAFTQSDIRYQPEYADYDHVLLRLTSDDVLMWGDAGEAVFMIRSEDLAKGDFSRVAYSWDCT